MTATTDRLAHLPALVIDWFGSASQTIAALHTAGLVNRDGSVAANGFLVGEVCRPLLGQPVHFSVTRDREFVARVEFERAELVIEGREGRLHFYGTMPETLKAGLLGRDMAAVLGHPLIVRERAHVLAEPVAETNLLVVRFQMLMGSQSA